MISCLDIVHVAWWLVKLVIGIFMLGWCVSSKLTIKITVVVNQMIMMIIKIEFKALYIFHCTCICNASAEENCNFMPFIST